MSKQKADSANNNNTNWAASHSLLKNASSFITKQFGSFYNLHKEIFSSPYNSYYLGLLELQGAINSSSSLEPLFVTEISKLHKKYEAIRANASSAPLHKDDVLENLHILMGEFLVKLIMTITTNDTLSLKPEQQFQASQILWSLHDKHKVMLATDEMLITLGFLASYPAATDQRKVYQDAFAALEGQLTQEPYKDVYYIKRAENPPQGSEAEVARFVNDYFQKALALPSRNSPSEALELYAMWIDTWIKKFQPLYSAKACFLGVTPYIKGFYETIVKVKSEQSAVYSEILEDYAKTYINAAFAAFQEGAIDQYTLLNTTYQTTLKHIKDLRQKLNPKQYALPSNIASILTGSLPLGTQEVNQLQLMLKRLYENALLQVSNSRSAESIQQAGTVLTDVTAALEKISPLVEINNKKSSPLWTKLLAKGKHYKEEIDAASLKAEAQERVRQKNARKKQRQEAAALQQQQQEEAKKKVEAEEKVRQEALFQKQQAQQQADKRAVEKQKSEMAKRQVAAKEKESQAAMLKKQQQEVPKESEIEKNLRAHIQRLEEEVRKKSEVEKTLQAEIEKTKDTF